jgi:hypothetical protein
MFREIIPILITLAIALAGGIFVTDEVTRNFEGFGELKIGDWTAFPNAGSPAADPYARARTARTGRIALGSAEGLAFVATQDSDGQPLVATCNYLISGKTATARAWTLRITDDQLQPIVTGFDEARTAHSGNVLRKSDGSFAIEVSQSPSPGNWVQIAGDGVRYFVLTLYDTSVASTTGISDFTMPAINRVSCNG